MELTLLNFGGQLNCYTIPQGKEAVEEQVVVKEDSEPSYVHVQLEMSEVNR